MEHHLRDDCFEPNQDACEEKGCCWDPRFDLPSLCYWPLHDDYSSFVPSESPTNTPTQLECDTCCKKDARGCGRQQCYKVIGTHALDESSRDGAHERCKEEGFLGLATIENICELRQAAWLCMVKFFPFSFLFF